MVLLLQNLPLVSLLVETLALLPEKALAVLARQFKGLVGFGLSVIKHVRLRGEALQLLLLGDFVLEQFPVLVHFLHLLARVQLETLSDG